MTGARRSVLALAAVGGVWITVACLDVSSPISGIASISRIITSAPSVVTGDSLRDTTGAATRLQVFAYGPTGDVVTDLVVRYYVIDTTHQLHVDSISGFVWGDTLSPNAAIFARVSPASGKGSLDTPLDTIPVVPAPAGATSDTNFTFLFDPGTTPDTNVAGLISLPFGVTLKANSGTPVQKYLVGFDVVRAPAPKSSDVGPTVVLSSPLSTNDSTYAISDASGRATLRLRVRKSALTGALLGGASDTAVVRFRVWLRGQTLPVTPSDSIIITVRRKI